MPDDPKPSPEPAAQGTPPPPAAKPVDAEQEKEIGDFITRQVLEKDSVFFEG